VSDGTAGDWAWLEGRQRFGIKPGLERVRELLARLGRPDRCFEVVLVTGTNGKGSVSALLHAMLVADGRLAGRFTSPHLERFEERAVVHGGAADRARLVGAAAVARPHVEAIDATYFEAVTAIGLLAFAEAGVEVAVVEAGMGGRWDATNATEPRLSIITSVALDHVEVLGRTVEAIAVDKAGIARPGRPLLCGASGPALAVVAREAAAVGALAWALDEATWSWRDLGWDGVEVEVAVPGGSGSPVVWQLATPLLGAHQARNLALAGAAAALLGVDEAAARSGARDVSWPGRLERVDAHGRTWLLDGAHNPAGAVALATALASLAPDGVAVLVLGVNADKDVAGVIEPLRSVAAQVVLTRAVASARASRPEDLGDLWRALAPGVPQEPAPDPAAAIVAATAASREGDLIVVAGSLFLVGEVRGLLRGERPQTAVRWQ
jgi:dihydrofolate synthase / folylpolyglutamate synthase